MTNGRKKKQVNPSKLELTSDLYYSQLQNPCENIHREALNAFNKLASHEKLFLHLEAKVLESSRKLEAIKISMIDIQSDKNEDEKPSKFGCESCHNWQKEINALQVKLDKALQPKIAYAIDPSKYEREAEEQARKEAEDKARREEEQRIKEAEEKAAAEVAATAAAVEAEAKAKAKAKEVARIAAEEAAKAKADALTQGEHSKSRFVPLVLKTLEELQKEQQVVHARLDQQDSVNNNIQNMLSQLLQRMPLPPNP
ncbi:eukaryotic translation initiation factor 4 gamma-like [Lathyrus oleraceus]|uniref:eukaryotic translation initiation factor 4 gamma-like n=1 Tax=Pisum sativum TaxID=3888 RepID=UPI0021D0F14D|nr:eukaryotic translation initiation factor 4 gamma-like [Pisum sativum]